ncbi:MAG: protein kinase [Proteobacteria bacterium]|nr:protein kinase [Pseudomonadota bacterium]
MLEPGEVIDRYTVEEILGQGGMAVVYRVRHNQLDSFHAIKILTITNPSIKDRLIQEGKVQASLRHPNIVAVTDVLEIRGAPGLVMEFIEGPGLDEWLEQHEPTVDDSIRIFEAMALGVAHAHDKGVVHRDLKPANVLMAPASGAWVPKVADFGLAKAVTEDGSMQKTRSGVTMGTPQYMAPEQIRDAKSVDQRADVFSLGCILYELVCGRPPFVGPDILSIFNAVASGSFPAAVSLVPDLPPGVRDAIEGALVVDRDNRIGSVAEMLQVLRGAPLSAATSQARHERLSGGPKTWAPDSPGMAVAASAVSRAASRAGSPSGGTIDPGSAASFGGSGPKKRRVGMMVGGGLIVVSGVAGLAVAGLAGGALFASNAVETSVADTLARSGDLSASDVSLGPTGLVLTDFAIDGPDGEPVLTAKSLSFEANPSAFRGSDWQVSRVVISGVGGELQRGVDGRFHLAGTAEKRLRDGLPFRIRAAELVIEEGEVDLSSKGTLQVAWDSASLTDFDLNLDGGMEWSSSAGTLTSLEVGAVEPLLRVEQISVADGDATLEGLELWVRGRTDGMLDLPPVLADEVADWAGGTRHQPESRDWLGIDTTSLPVAVNQVHAKDGTLHIIDRANGVKTVGWDIELDRVALGPRTSERFPVGLSGSVGDGRITLDGDIAADGLMRFEMGLRYLPVELLEPYFAPSLKQYGVAIEGGKVGGTMAMTAQQNTFASVVELTGEDIAFTGASPTRKGKRLLSTRAKVESSKRIEGNLAGPKLSPFAAVIDQIEQMVFAPAGGGVVDAARAAERAKAQRQRERDLAAARAAAAAADVEATPEVAPAPAPAEPTSGTSMSRGGEGTPEAEPTTPEPETPAEEPAPPTPEEAKKVWQQMNRGVRDALDSIPIRKK